MQSPSVGIRPFRLEDEVALRHVMKSSRSRGAGRIKLSFEAENELSLGLYRRTEFETAVEWPHWTRPVVTSNVQKARWLCWGNRQNDRHQPSTSGLLSSPDVYDCPDE
jgi:hypothetical protein